MSNAAERKTTRRTTVVGSILVLAIPVGYFLLGQLATAGLVPSDAIRPLLNEFGVVGWLGLFVLGPVGIAMVVWSRGLRGIRAIVMFVVSLPFYLVAWFIGVAVLSGALGNPL